MGKTAIVIGATGLVGRKLINQLAGTNKIQRVVAVTRRRFEHSWANVTNEVVDFDQLEKYAAVFRGDYLFSSLGTTLKQAGSIEAQRVVDYDYQLTAARLASANGVGHYLLVSSGMADARSNSPYLKMKGELEEAVLQLPFQRISIFQPGLLMGEREHPRLGEKIAGAILPSLASIPGLGKFRPIQDHQVAAKMVQVSQTPGPQREWFRFAEVFP
jgi:uncharacterized protein YbjT (DUF2867 family)